MTCEVMARTVARVSRETSREDEKWMYLPTEVGQIKEFGVGQMTQR
ncbi:hypothetical protein J2W91_004653 [Paenibacillus amylolyticus]|uniref:Uncharacterized protein n=1 Tax=Paenibacillus amylolyticus TaxID=1451 RepID=A0AAP5H5B4_PAEAM|nr:hypothetical protein [Paenibacillus amylolyticus]MDR6726147.1 hypothetical protein [Paenibacillus amylolyticus]